jgi:hypothetical protein
MKKSGWGIGAILIAAAPAAFAATQVDGVLVTPNPASFTGNVPPQVEIAVIVNRGQFDRQACDVLIETGDGSAPLRLSFARGDERKSVRYAYPMPGSYTLRAVAAYGCTGMRTANVAVYGPSYPAPAVAPVPSPAAAESTPQGGCPAGWWVVPESVQGARYTCRPNLPPVPLKCGAGTSYFSGNGVIGCR